MKSPFLTAALGLLVVSNTWVLIHAALNRSGTLDSELDLTTRELRYNGAGTEDSSATLSLVFENPVAQYRIGPAPRSGTTGWFDRQKLAELGFDTSVPPDARDASRFYLNPRSREIFVAIEYDGPAWQQWLKEREPLVSQEYQYGAEISTEQRLEIERQTSSRLVAIDAALDPAVLRAKYPDRKHVMILRGLARVILEGYPPYLRGGITGISTDSINVPAALRKSFYMQSYYVPYTFEKQQLKINPPSYAVTLRVGSRYEPWVENVRPLR